MKVYKVTNNAGISCYFDVEENFSNVLNDIEDVTLELEVGETVEVTLVEMTEKEFKKANDLLD